MSIPKIVHFCWLSGDLYPDLVQKCIQSWNDKLPDYEIRLWDKNSFDIHSVPWVEQACEAKKWAFAADYIRLYALYNFGGIYLDSDVEVLKSFDGLLDRPYFFCKEHTPDMIENSLSIEAATMGCLPKNDFIGKCLEFYKNQHFINPDGSFNMITLPTVMARVYQSFKQIEILPMEYFSPKNTRTLAIEKTENTYSIHHFNGSWHSLAQQKHVALRTKMCSLYGERAGEIIATIGAVFINIYYDGLCITIKKILSKLKK